MGIDFIVEPQNDISIIKVLGVGGGGGNAVNYMFNQGIAGVEFLICNTDKQALDKSPLEEENKIQIGKDLTGGRGVGGNPETGKKAVMEDIETIKNIIGKETDMLFITAGMGGGTGTGATPEIARLALDMDILTVGIITYPFKFEGSKRRDIAEKGIEEIRKNVDALIIIHNERLLEMHKGLGLSMAFAQADNVLAIAAKGIAEIITETGVLNVDFEDVKSVMKNSGTAILSTASADGENRAQKSIEYALSSPLLKDNQIKGAKHILLNLSYGNKEIEIEELNIITEYIKEEVGQDVDLKFGYGSDKNLKNELSVTIVATVLNSQKNIEEDKRKIIDLDDIKSVMKNSGTAILSTASADGENRAQKSIEYALSSPLLKDNQIKGAKHILLNLSYGNKEIETEELKFITEYIKEEVGQDVDLKFGYSSDKNLKDELSVTIVATVLNFQNNIKEDKKYIIDLDDGKNIKEKPQKEQARFDYSLEGSRKSDMDDLRKNKEYLRTQKGLEDTENVPAYERKGIKLRNVTHSSDSSISKYSLDSNDPKKPEIKENNPFLNNNVD
ncbi:MAG: cell division protein FtsZ [Bacteroidota bacterium]|nr:cell division protein FtsZ [Bacteroidota bacterium]